MHGDLVSSSGHGAEENLAKLIHSRGCGKTLAFEVYFAVFASCSEYLTRYFVLRRHAQLNISSFSRIDQLPVAARLRAQSKRRRRSETVKTQRRGHPANV